MNTRWKKQWKIKVYDMTQPLRVHALAARRWMGIGNATRLVSLDCNVGVDTSTLFLKSMLMYLIRSSFS